MDHLICGLNEVHFELEEVHLIWQLVKILGISFDDHRASHVALVKALHFNFFVAGDASKSNIPAKWAR